jgi:hypothetical protein
MRLVMPDLIRHPCHCRALSVSHHGLRVKPAMTMPPGCHPGLDPGSMTSWIAGQARNDIDIAIAKGCIFVKHNLPR